MSQKRTVIALVVGSLAAVLLVGTVMAHPGGGFVDRVDVLARALGITGDEVEQAKEDGTLGDLLDDLTRGDLVEAYEATAIETIDEASDDGRITSEQAESLKDRVSGAFPAFDRSTFEELRSLRGLVKVDVKAVYASVLGITTEALNQAIEDGTLREQLEEIDRVALAAALLDAWHAAIDEALADGDITAEQAELLRQSGKGFGHGHRGFGHHGRFRGGYGCAPVAGERGEAARAFGAGL